MTTAADVLTGAASWIGTTEQPPGSDYVPGITDWYGMNGQPWCAMFVSRVFYDAGLPLPAQTPKGFAWCTAGAEWFAAQGRLIPDPTQARPGDVVFFEWDHVGGLDHVGIVQGTNPDGLVCIEGNVGARVGLFRRSYSDAVSLGRPPFTPPPNPNPENPEMKSIILVDPRDSKNWHAFGNTKVYLSDPAQVQLLTFFGAATVNPAPVAWIDALATLPR
jgi:hypothetical protein